MGRYNLTTRFHAFAELAEQAELEAAVAQLELVDFKAISANYSLTHNLTEMLNSETQRTVQTALIFTTVTQHFRLQHDICFFCKTL